MARLIRANKRNEGQRSEKSIDSLSFDFRLRFNMLKGDHINSRRQELELMRLSDGVPIRLRAGSRGTPINASHEIAILGGPYVSTDDAAKAGELCRNAVLLWAVRERIGVDFGDGFQRSFLTEFGKLAYKQQKGGTIRNDQLGLDVYASSGNPVFAMRDVQLGLGKNAETFSHAIYERVIDPPSLSEKQILAAELYCASFFDVPFRSRFLTLVTAIEALIEPSRRPDEIQSYVDDAKKRANDLRIDEATRRAIQSSLEWIRRDSIGQGGRQLCDKLLKGRQYEGKTAGSFFKYCYGLRSEIVHYGKTKKRVDMLKLSNACQGLVGDLLQASLGLATR